MDKLVPQACHIFEINRRMLNAVFRRHIVRRFAKQNKVTHDTSRSYCNGLRTDAPGKARIATQCRILHDIH